MSEERSCYNCAWCNMDDPISPFRECSIQDEDGFSFQCDTDELENWIPRKEIVK